MHCTTWVGSSLPTATATWPQGKMANRTIKTTTLAGHFWHLGHTKTATGETTAQSSPSAAAETHTTDACVLSVEKMPGATKQKSLTYLATTHTLFSCIPHAQHPVGSANAVQVPSPHFNLLNHMPHPIPGLVHACSQLVQAVNQAITCPSHNLRQGLSMHAAAGSSGEPSHDLLMEEN